MAGKSISKTLVWILMGLLILGLGGFGVTNLSGTVRTVATVGNAEISVDEYARTLRNEIRALEAEREGPVSFSEAQQMGLPDQVLAQLVNQAALDHEADRLGISVGDDTLRDQILAMRGFQGSDGGFDREAYTYALEQAGLSEAEFEEDIRDETARAVLQSAVMAGVTMPAPYIETLIDYVAERRNITWTVLDRNDLETGLPEPTQADLRRYHQSNLPQFTTPETKKITYAWLTPEMIIDTVEIDRQALREAYEAREAEFNTPERRLVERLAFSDRAAAEAAKERLEAGEVRFDDLVADRGLTLEDIDMGEVTRGDLGKVAKAVFDADSGAVVGPVESAVGPALFRVNAILEAQSTSFAEALPDLRNDLAGARARRVVDSKIERAADLLAGGATVEDLAEETDLKLGEIAWHEGLREGIAAYPGFRQAAEEISLEDYPEVMELEDGGIFAMRLDKVQEPQIQPIEDVRESVAKGWRRQQVAAQLKEQIQDDLTQLRAGTGFSELGYSTETAEDLTRRGFQPGTPPQFIETVFGMSEGEVSVLEGAGRIFIIRLDAVQPPDTDSEELTQVRSALRDQAANGLSQDLYRLLAADIRQRAGIEIDEQARNAVHANFQ